MATFADDWQFPLALLIVAAVVLVLFVSCLLIAVWSRHTRTLQRVVDQYDNDVELVEAFPEYSDTRRNTVASQNSNPTTTRLRNQSRELSQRTLNREGWRSDAELRASARRSSVDMRGGVN